MIDTQSEIALALRQRLINNLGQVATSSNTWIDDAPLPWGKDPPPYQNCFSIMLNDGFFDREWSGSPCSLKEFSGFVITHMLKLHLDQPKHLTQVIAEAEQSMLWVKKAILTAYLSEPTGNQASRAPWRPKSANGKYLWDFIQPKNYVAPKRHQDWPLLYQQTEFQMTFYWDL